MLYYENLNELKQYDEDLFKELKENLPTGDWRNHGLTFFGSSKGFAEYELYEGWYANFFGDLHRHGAPNPLDYIDLEAFADELIASWDSSCNYLTTDGRIVVSSYGW